MIYLVKAGEYHKIGFSNCVQKRIDSLQVANAEKIELIDSWPGTAKDESAIHRALRKSKVRGEWYSLTEKDLKFLEGLASEERAQIPSKPIPLEVGCELCGRHMVFKDFHLVCECGNKTDPEAYSPEKQETIRLLLEMMTR